MKSVRFSSLFILAAFVSCDKLEDPVIRLNNQYLEGVYGPPPEFVPMDDPQRNVLVEEFTGHLCGFCPPATALVKELNNELGERLVPVTIHAGTLAEVGDAPFDTDYNTPEGDIYWGQLEGGFNPCARIDRQGGTSNFFVDNQWEAIIRSRLDVPVDAAMQMITEYVPEDRNLNIHVNTRFLNALDGPFQLVVLLLESHLISAQEDYDQTPSEIPDYEHNHILRTGVTRAEGQPLIRNPRMNDEITSSFTLPMKEGWTPANCEVVAYILDAGTGEVLNAVESELTE